MENYMIIMPSVAIEVSYKVLAPISVAAGLTFLGLFIYSPRFRKCPNDLVIGQIMAQTVFDAHWLTAAASQGYE